MLYCSCDVEALRERIVRRRHPRVVGRGYDEYPLDGGFDRIPRRLLDLVAPVDCAGFYDILIRAGHFATRRSDSDLSAGALDRGWGLCRRAHGAGQPRAARSARRRGRHPGKSTLRPLGPTAAAA